MKQLLFILLFGLSIFSFGQTNLVSNSGFDILSQCPYSSGQINFAPSWFQPIRQVSSSDLYNSCNGGGYSTPLNIVGHQIPYSDSGYSGIILYAPLFVSFKNYREYIEAYLISPLKKEYTYCVEFHVSLADTTNYAISSIGVHFSTDSLLIDSFPYLINVSPQIQNDSLTTISDKENWTKISGNFIAIGGERFLTIGNFFDDTQTIKNSTRVSNYPNNDYAYYYIDNVSVYACDSPLVEEPQDSTFIFIPNVFSPNQDGENDLWEVIANKVNSLNVKVFNRWGEQVYIFNSKNLQSDTSSTHSVTYNPAWDGYTPTGKPVPEGTYFYIVQYTLPSGETKVEKGNLTLIR